MRPERSSSQSQVRVFSLERRPLRLERPDLEGALISNLMASESAVRTARASGLRAEDFTEGRWREAYRRITEEGAPGFEGMPPGVEPAAAAPEAVAKRAAALRRLSLLRSLRDVMRDMYRGVRPVDESLRRAERLAREARLAGSAMRFPERVSVLVDQLADDLARPVRRVPFGIEGLDSMTGGGLRPGDYAILAGRPGMGKTSLAVQVAARAADAGRSVLFVSLEMCPKDVAAKVLSVLTDITAGDVRFGRVSAEKLRQAAAALEAVELVVGDGGRRLVGEVVSEVGRLREAGGLDLVVVDYVQLLQTEERHRDRSEQVTAVSAALCRCAKDYEVPVLALSQLSRAPEQRKDRRPSLADLRESGALEQDADLVIFLYRPGYYDPEAGDAAEIVVAKHRHGPTGTVPVWFDARRQVFLEHPPEIEVPPDVFSG